MLKKLPLIYDERGRWRVDMPCYAMMAGSVGPVTQGLIDGNGVVHGAAPDAVLALHPFVTVALPEDTPIKADGSFDASALRKMYAEHPRFGTQGWTPPAVL